MLVVLESAEEVCDPVALEPDVVVGEREDLRECLDGVGIHAEPQFVLGIAVALFHVVDDVVYLAAGHGEERCECEVFVGCEQRVLLCHPAHDLVGARFDGRSVVFLVAVADDHGSEDHVRVAEELALGEDLVYLERVVDILLRVLRHCHSREDYELGRIPEG